MAKKILFPVALIALVAMILEGVARISMPLIEHAADDGSWRRVWAAEHSETREIYYEFDVFDPLLGWRSKPELRESSLIGSFRAMGPEQMLVFHKGMHSPFDR